VRLFANLFRPPTDGPWAVILSVTPCGRNKLLDRLSSFFMRLSGVKFGKLNCSRIENGYAVQICIGNLHFMAECRRRSFFPFGSGPGSKVAQAPISARRIFLADDSALRWMTLLLVVETTRSRRH
jgi:hypothetical protein